MSLGLAASLAGHAHCAGGEFGHHPRPGAKIAEFLGAVAVPAAIDQIISLVHKPEIAKNALARIWLARERTYCSITWMGRQLRE